MLHYVLGFANAMLKELDQMADPEHMRQLYATIGVRKGRAAFNAFTGNDLRKIMARIDEITDGLPHPLPLIPKVQQISRALQLLKQVQDCTESKFLNFDERMDLGARVEHLLRHMRDNMPLETVKQKGHMLFRHALEFAEEWGNLTWFSEQGIESFHAIYRRQAERYKMRANDKQKFMLQWHFGEVLREARRERPENAEEYDFEDEEFVDEE